MEERDTKESAIVEEASAIFNWLLQKVKLQEVFPIRDSSLTQPVQNDYFKVEEERFVQSQRSGSEKRNTLCKEDSKETNSKVKIKLKSDNPNRNQANGKTKSQLAIWLESCKQPRGRSPSCCHGTTLSWDFHQKRKFATKHIKSSAVEEVVSLEEIFKEMSSINCTSLEPISLETTEVEFLYKSCDNYLSQKRKMQEKQTNEVMHQDSLSSQEKRRKKKETKISKRLRKIEKSLHKWRSKKLKVNEQLLTCL